MGKRVYAFPESMEGIHIRSVRRQLNLTQAQFALLAGVSRKTVEHWESGSGEVHGPVVPLARILIERPELVEYFTIPEQTAPLRLYYYFREELCTIIDVDEIKRKVQIRNYTNRLQHRAFGINECPGFDDYMEFLKSRCFPETRDKIKLELKRLGIPYYDPMLIIEKTEGRMAEDEFHLRVVRKQA